MADDLGQLLFGRSSNVQIPTPASQQPTTGPVASGLDVLPVRRKFGKYDNLIKQHADVNGIPFDIAHSLASLEGMNPGVVSSAGAVGVMQILPSTASEVEGRSVTAEELKDPATNIRIGTKYLKQMMDKFDSVPLGIAAYQAGPGNIRKAGNRIPNTTDGISTTKQYVATVLSLAGQDVSQIANMSEQEAQDQLGKLLGVKRVASRGEMPGRVAMGAPIPQPDVSVQPDAPKPVNAPKAPSQEKYGLPASMPQFVSADQETTRADIGAPELSHRKQFPVADEIPSAVAGAAPLEISGPAAQISEIPFIASAAAAIPGVKSLIKAFSGGDSEEVMKALKDTQEQNPAAATTGAVLSTVAQAIPTGMGVGVALSKIPAIASNPLLLSTLTRMVTSGGLTGTRQSWKENFGESLLNTLQGAGAGAVSVIPEVVAPANAWQLLAQPLADLVFDAGIDKLRGRDVGTKNWWKNEALNLALSEGFAIRDVASGSVFKVQQGEMRQQLGDGTVKVLGKSDAFLNQPAKLAELFTGKEVELRPVDTLSKILFKQAGIVSMEDIAKGEDLRLRPERVQPGPEDAEFETARLGTTPEGKIEESPEGTFEAIRAPKQPPSEADIAKLEADEQRVDVDIHPTASKQEAAPTIRKQIDDLTEPVPRSEVRPVKDSELLNKIAEQAQSVDDFVEATAQRGAVSFGKGSDLDKSLTLPTSVNPEAEARFKAAKGIKQPPLLERLKDTVKKVKNSFTRLFPELDPKTDGQLIDILRLHAAVPEYSKLAAASTIRGVTAGLGPKKMEVFEKNIIFPDILRDIDRGLYDGKPLPFGYKDRAEIEQDAQTYRDILDSNPDIKQSVEARNRMMGFVTQEAVDNGLLPKEVLDNPSYFHHQVLEHMATKDFKGVGTGSQDVRNKQKGWQKGRIGSGKDFNTSYLESEFEVMSQMISQLETVKTLGRIKSTADISDDLKVEAKESGVEDWRELVPDDHVLWQPKQGTAFYQANSLSDKVINDVLSGAKELTPDDLKQVLAVGGQRTQWAIPERLAKTLDNFMQVKDEGPVGEISKSIMKNWKIWRLLNPFGVVKYNVNNMSGDLDIALAHNPAILKEVPKAASELWEYNVKKKAPTPEILKAVRKGVVDSGFSAQEVPDISKSELFSAITGKKPNVITRGWQSVKDFTQYRENILRLAAYRHFKKELAKGKVIRAASKKTEIDAIQDPDDKAAKLARELIGDYGAISQAGQWIRSHMMPFYSWMEINAPRYVRLLKNLPEEGDPAGAAKRTAGVIAGKTAIKGGALAAKATGLYALVQLWNHTFFPDEEKELGESARRQHIILGKTEEGKILSLRFQGALSDALSWVAAEDLPNDIGDVVSGKATIGEKAKETVTEGVSSRIWNALGPQFKLPVELTAGVSTFPSPFKPRPVRDRGEQLAQVLALNIPYRWAKGIPTRGLEDDLMRTVIAITDPGENAYFEAKNLVRKYIEEQTPRSPFGGSPTPKGNALYYYKKAKRYGHEKAAQRWLNEYEKLGGKRSSIQQSIRSADPMRGLQTGDKREFFRGLTPEERQTIDRAQNWYRRVYKPAR